MVVRLLPEQFPSSTSIPEYNIHKLMKPICPVFEPERIGLLFYSLLMKSEFAPPNDLLSYVW